MSNASNNASGNKGSPSNPNRPAPRNDDESPRRIVVPADIAAHLGSPGSHHGASSSRPARPSPGSSHGPSGGGAFEEGFGRQAVPVGGGGVSGGVGAPANVGSPVGRKRERNVEEGAAGGANNQPGDGGRREYRCSVCNRAFGSPKAVFGHMRTHPGRGWTGAHPPPVFNADEEFADIRGAEAAAAALEAPPAPALAPAPAPAPGENVFRLPDLNDSPPNSE